MRKLFKKGERVRSKIDGKVMEVLKYLKSNLVEVRWFDLQAKEVRVNKIKEDKLSKAAWKLIIHLFNAPVNSRGFLLPDCKNQYFTG